MHESYEERREEHKERTDPGPEEEKEGRKMMYPQRDPDAEAPEIEPGVGGYQGRDPAEDMPPKLPSVPESQDDEES